MNAINWSEIEECELNPEYDLCGIFNGKYVDVVRDESGLWTPSFNGVRIKESIKTRLEAKEYVESVDLIDVLSNKHEH
ncbi:hypothetical protein GW796_08270 [archaeon]|nr:hypothetical protein [archaeon]